MATRVSRKRIGENLVGRIISFDRLKGYGFIRTFDGEDIIFSSYDVPKDVWSKICVGDYVKFIVGTSEATKYTVAVGTTITEKMPYDEIITLPNNEKLQIRHIYKFGKSSMVLKGYDKIYPDCPRENFDYVFIETYKKNYIFNHYGSPIVIDGEADINQLFDNLNNLIVRF